jgi:hypothetical protein
MATSQTCCHLPGELLNSAAQCADRARIVKSLKKLILTIWFFKRETQKKRENGRGRETVTGAGTGAGTGNVLDPSNAGYPPLVSDKYHLTICVSRSAQPAGVVHIATARVYGTLTNTQRRCSLTIGPRWQKDIWIILWSSEQERSLTNLRQKLSDS